MALDHRLERSLIGFFSAFFIALAIFKIVSHNKDLYLYDDSTQWWVMSSIIVSGLIGAILSLWIGMELKYRRLHQFVSGLDYITLRNAVKEDLFSRAGQAQRSSEKVSQLQNRGLAGMGYDEGADYEGTYKHLQDYFRVDQGNLYNRYDLAKEFEKDFGLTLPERSIAKILDAKYKADYPGGRLK